MSYSSNTKRGFKLLAFSLFLFQLTALYADNLPAGTYQSTCKEDGNSTCSVSGTTLTCRCNNSENKLSAPTNVNISKYDPLKEDIVNNNGHLQIRHKGQPVGTPSLF